jgi:epoxyqueuosine reductase QueG
MEHLENQLREIITEIVEINDSDNFGNETYEAVTDFLTTNSIEESDFVDEDEYHTIISEIMDQSLESVRINFSPSTQLIELLAEIKRIKESKKCQ